MKRFEAFLSELEKQSRLRSIPEETCGLVDLVSNDYLGISLREPEYKEEFLRLYGDASFSSSASRLLSRKQRYFAQLEGTLGELYGKSALLFNSGYHANTGTICGLADKNVLFLVDRLMHASGWDGLALAQGFRHAEMKRFPHNDTGKLESIIREEKRNAPDKEIVIVTESIFSMDGDLAPLEEIVRIKNRYDGCMLYLDEAHAFGTRGERGLGLAEEKGLTDEVEILVGTLGKSAASAGAFVITNATLRNYLLNTARSFIFSTALPPVNIAWSLYLLPKIIGMTEERRHLKKLSKEFARMLSSLHTEGNNPQGESQIIPYLCGSASRSIELAARLREGGYDVLPIRRPTVPPGGERIRFSLNSSLKIEQLTRIPEIIAEN